MREHERRKRPRDTDRLREAKERLEEALHDARWLRSQLDIIGRGESDRGRDEQASDES